MYGPLADVFYAFRRFVGSDLYYLAGKYDNHRRPKVSHVAPRCGNVSNSHGELSESGAPARMDTRVSVDKEAVQRDANN